MIFAAGAAALFSVAFGATGLISTQNDRSGEALAQLDPIRIAGSVCGGRMGDPRSRQAWLATARMAAAAATPAIAPPVRLLDGLGDPRFRITTRNPDAQRFFNQGLMLAYGFNHDEAIRSFREAQRLDPECAMCWWGESYALGPNINLPMDAGANPRAYGSARRALALKEGAGPEERALIDAIQQRYAASAPSDRAPLDRAFASAMANAARRFPASDTIALVAAEAEMDTRPWDYFESDRRTPKGGIGGAVALVERVLARSPDHAQAAHLYIHLMENTAFPEKAEAAADRLARPLAPAAGHLVHMPGHLYYRLGRFRDSIGVNVDAARADEDISEARGTRASTATFIIPIMFTSS